MESGLSSTPETADSPPRSSGAPSRVLPRRIPRAWLPEPADPEPFRHGGVLRGAHARVAPAFEVNRDWSADFPVPASDADTPAPEEASAPNEPPAARRAAWEAEADARQAEAVAAAREAAYAEGLAAGRAEAAATTETRQAALSEDAERLHALWADAVERAEPLLVGLALDTAERLLAAPLSDAARDAATDALTAAVDRIATDAPVSVALHPVDYLRLQESGIVEHLNATHPGLSWTPNSSFAEGDWTVDSPKSAVRRVKAELLQALRSDLGLSPDASDEAVTD